MIKNELKVLNTIRGIAALLVVISHYSNVTKLFDKLLGAGGGQLGVMIFFILSGFLISYIYLNKSFTKVEVYRYVVSRLARVVPLFYFVVVVSFFIHVTSEFNFQYQIKDFNTLIAHLVFAYGVSVLWTIPVEIQFYLIFIGIWWLSSVNKKPVYLVVLILCCSLFYFKPQISFIFFDQKIKLSILKSLPFFLTGLIFGWFYHYFNKLPKSRIWGFSIALVFLVYPSIYTQLFNHENHLWYSITSYTALTVFFFTWVFMIPEKSRIFSNKVGDFLGKISYSIYLLHLPVLYLMKSYLREWPMIYFPVYIVIVIGFSFLSFKLVESPCRSLIKERLLFSKTNH